LEIPIKVISKGLGPYSFRITEKYLKNLPISILVEAKEHVVLPSVNY